MSLMISVPIIYITNYNEKDQNKTIELLLKYHKLSEIYYLKAIRLNPTAESYYYYGYNLFILNNIVKLLLIIRII